MVLYHTEHTATATWAYSGLVRVSFSSSGPNERTPLQCQACNNLTPRISITQLDLSPGSDRGRHFRFLQYDHEFSYGGNPELLHHMGTMSFNGLFRHCELSANLLVEHARGHELHNLEFARR